MNNDNKAFSLIELSIVLIIIGLLVAGIIGGQSLIESAKVRSAINTFRDIEQQILAFKVKEDRLPGFCNNDIVVEGIYSCRFPYPYDGTNEEYGIPDYKVAPFVELYLSGISNFEPKNTDKVVWKSPWGTVMQNEGAYPGLFNNNHYPITIESFQIGAEDGYRHDIKEENLFLVAYNVNPSFKTSFVKKLDQKIDDGIFNHGKVRGACFDIKNGQPANLYSRSYENGDACHKIIYQTGIRYK